LRVGQTPQPRVRILHARAILLAHFLRTAQKDDGSIVVFSGEAADGGLHRDERRVPISTLKQWRAHVFDADRDGIRRFFDGLNELASIWCAGGTRGVPEEVASLLATGWAGVNVTRIAAAPQVATGVGAAMFSADVMLNATTSAGGLIVVVLAGKLAYGSETPLVDAEPTLADGLCELVLGRRFLKSGRPDPELARLPLRQFMASAAALHTAKTTGASAAAVIIHEIVTPATFNDDVRLGRSMLMAFVRAMGLEDLRPGVLTEARTRRRRANTPALWFGLCLREMPAMSWIV
jgi:hypothetical protein